MEELAKDPRAPLRPGAGRARSAMQRCAVALLLPLLALLLRLGLTPWLGDASSFPLFYLSVAFSAWYGGLGPGVLATLFGALLAALFLFAPRPALALRTGEGALPVLLYLGVGLLVSWLAESLHHARRRAEAAATVLAASEAQYRHVSARAPCLLWHAEIHDRGGELLHWNLQLANPEAAQRFFPLLLAPGQDYQNAWYHSRLLEDQLRANAYGVGEIRAGRSYRQEFRCRRADGEICWFAEEIEIETVAPDCWRAVGVCTEITARKRLEEERAGLAAEVQERAEQLARADRAKDQFLAVLAHELRNPIGAISNAAQLLKLRAGGDARLGRSLSIIERQVKHQEHMLDDLLNISRIVRGKLTLHLIHLDLTRLVRDVAEDQRATLERAGLTLDCELPEVQVWMKADPTRLAQVLGNLLHNASKFTDPGGRITLRLTLDMDGRHGHISVRDTGMGIEPELLPHLFESFIQAERTLERSRGGLGLGLALVKGLVELHGGTVTGRSEGPGHGAEFTLHLPLAEREPDSKPAPPPTYLPPSAWRILIIEDNEDAALSLQELLEALGCQAAVASSGAEGLEIAQQFHPEIVLCDLGLPRMNGFEVARALRELPGTASACLIAISGYGQEDDRRRSREAGFDQHLTKPIHFEELRQLLELSSNGPCGKSGEAIRG